MTQRSPDIIVIGDDVWQTHLAARQGLATTIKLRGNADWLWGPRRSGRSPWYSALELEVA